MEYLLARQAANAAALENIDTETATDNRPLRQDNPLTMMKSYVHLELVADCPFSAALDYATDYLRRAETHLTFTVRNDTDERGRSHDELCVRWAARAPLVPHFVIDGTVRFRIAGSCTRLVLDASYAPPPTALGRILDAVLGHRVAVKICRDLLGHVAAELTERERALRSGYVTRSAC